MKEEMFIRCNVCKNVDVTWYGTVRTRFMLHVGYAVNKTRCVLYEIHKTCKPLKPSGYSTNAKFKKSGNTHPQLGVNYKEYDLGKSSHI